VTGRLPPRIGTGILRIAALLIATLLLSIGHARATGSTRAIDANTRHGVLPTDVYLPPAGTPVRGGAILSHGFMRSRHTMAQHARLLAREGVIAVTPNLPFQVDSHRNAEALHDIAAQLRNGGFGPATDRIVLVGFSAGALASVLAAVDLPGIAGLVALDAFDRPSGIGLAAAKRLTVPATAIRAPAAGCNAYGVAAPWGAAFPKADGDLYLDGATHCDFESPTDGVCRLFCFGSDEAKRRQVEDMLRAAVLRRLPLPQCKPSTSSSSPPTC
jgi:dienelactone hydrolase